MHKTDEIIKKKIVDRLFHSPYVDLANVTVKVCGGIIELAGAVADESQRDAAEDAACRISIVRDVHNHIAVTRPQRESHLAHVA